MLEVTFGLDIQTKFVLFSNVSLLIIKSKHLLARLSSLVSAEEDFTLLLVPSNDPAVRLAVS